MTERASSDLVSQPTPEQIERFSRLTPEERFCWLTDMLVLCYELATPEARASWREHEAQGRTPPRSR